MLVIFSNTPSHILLTLNPREPSFLGKFKPGDLVQVDYKISYATFKVRGWISRITFWKNCPYYHLNLPKKDGSRGLRVKSVCDGVLESITSISHIKLEDLKGGAK